MHWDLLKLKCAQNLGLRLIPVLGARKEQHKFLDGRALFGARIFFVNLSGFFFVIFFVFPCFSFGFLNMPSGSAYPPPLVGILFCVFS